MGPIDKSSGKSGTTPLVVLENPKTKTWFEQVVALLRSLSNDENAVSLEDLSNHMISIRNAVSEGDDQSQAEGITERVEALYKQVFCSKDDTTAQDKANTLFSSEDFRMMTPHKRDARVVGGAFNKGFIQEWIVPNMFKKYPDVEDFSQAEAVKNWVARTLISTMSKDELEMLKDQVDGIPLAASVNSVALRKLILKNSLR